ncbi:MAG: ligase-associated DNA damage response exonuclease [Planctomycetota bacterium]|nr:MAG: ligase-associated DNA damage response exonuclease [Planctomycetota bacterium]
MADVLEVTEAGLYCPAGQFWIDPWRRVPRAVITHAHADHARPGCDRYLCAAPGKLVLRSRLGGTVPIDSLRYGESLAINGAHVSFAPAGHILGSAQVRVEHRGTVWVVSGDYKTAADPTCDPIEPVRADVFITESTFGLPIYRWPTSESVAAEINAWWRANQAAGRTSVLLAYSLGKAQRLATMVDASIGPIVAHGSVMKIVRAYRDSGVRLPPIDGVPPRARRVGQGRALVIAPPSVVASAWLRLFGEASIAQASGWMTVRGIRRKRATSQAFVVSDHADFPGLLAVIEATQARRVLVTHGSSASLARLLCQRGVEADVLPTRGATAAAETLSDADHAGGDEPDPPTTAIDFPP